LIWAAALLAAGVLGGLIDLASPPSRSRTGKALQALQDHKGNRACQGHLGLVA